MITINHTHEIAERCFPDRAEIDVNKHKQGNQERCHNMKKIGQVKATGPENTGRNDLGVKQRPPGNYNNRYKDIHGANIGDLLEGIEFSF
jgi:hypothetical protein